MTDWCCTCGKPLKPGPNGGSLVCCTSRKHPVGRGYWSQRQPLPDDRWWQTFRVRNFHAGKTLILYHSPTFTEGVAIQPKWSEVQAE